MNPSGEESGGIRLDKFQREAIEYLDKGMSVMVSAPTGSGKTQVALHAIRIALSNNKRAFYTTPLKALSNQKFGELRQLFGVESVGLLTGDIAVNSDAPIVVMTTEILRNMIYERSDCLDELSHVVVDEVHYLQNPYRGGIWEEVIIHTPGEVIMVCLSATVSNAEEFGEWLRTVREGVGVVVETLRPVKLQNLYMVADRRTRSTRLMPVIVDGKPNPQGAVLDAPGLAAGLNRRIRGSTSGSFHRDPGRVHGRTTSTPRRESVVEHLDDHGMLPAIYFVFSRAGCERAVASCFEAGIRLTTSEERTQIVKIAEDKVAFLSDSDLDALGYNDWIGALVSGIASHHAGLVPIFKEIIEECFAAALVKIVFATETLALGVNMPARTVVIEKLTKFSGERHEKLSAAEFTQLTGRAGRRGIDNVGFGVVLWTALEPFSSVVQLVSDTRFELRSSFRPTYNMVANLVRTSVEKEARLLINLSFGQFQADSEIVRLEAELRKLPIQDSSRRAIETRVAKHANALSAKFDKVFETLLDFGYVDGWSLTPSGSRLCNVYHESDLLICLALDSGVFDGLNPVEMAMMATLFTYEDRQSRNSPKGRSWQADHSSMILIKERIGVLASLAERLALAETAAGLPVTRAPDGGFASLVSRWATGHQLGRVLKDSGIPAGDFVRNVKQVIDLLGQIACVAEHDKTRQASQSAIGLLRRGVVADESRYGGMVMNGM